MPNVDTRYDLESDCLTVKESGKKIKQSISLGNMTIDFDNQSRVIGIQLLNASEIIHFSQEVEDPVEFLQKIDDANLEYRWFEDGSLVVTAEIYQKTEDVVQEGIINSTTPAVSLA
ncbi:MAG: DUF2283 domain-containing protein [Candidatus Nanohaloarchaea archaeon]